MHNVIRIMTGSDSPAPFPLLNLPDSAILAVLRFCDARTLSMLELTGSDFFSRPAGRRLSLCEEVAKEAVLSRLGGSLEAAQRFRWVFERDCGDWERAAERKK